MVVSSDVFLVLCFPAVIPWFLPLHVSSLFSTILIYCTSLVFVSHIFCLHTHAFFTCYTVTTSYTIIHYTVFDVYVAHKKSSFLVIGVFFGLLDDLAGFLCTSEFQYHNCCQLV